MDRILGSLLQEQNLPPPDALGAALVNSSVIGLAALRGGRIVFANPAFIALFRGSRGMIGLPLADIVTDAGADRLEAALAMAEHVPTRYFGFGWRAEEASFDLELQFESVVLQGVPTIVAFASDVSDQQRFRQQLAYLAYTDTLTGLANRPMFADRLHEAMLRARRSGAAFAVLMLDLDGFKAVNDTCGHDGGDVVLQLVAQRLKGCVREEDTLARIGGDEFAVLLPHLGDQRSAALVAQRLIEALAAPFDFGMQPVTIGVSVGIACWPEHARSIDALLAAADTAMYRAKRSGKNQFQWAAGCSSTDLVALSPLTWNSAHAVGIQEIDAQHVQLAESIDRLSAALKNGLDQGSIGGGLNDLIRCATQHFATEERLMQEYGLDDTAPHREEHRRLLHDICNLKLDGDLPSISLILRYLQEWLVRHVDGLDRELARALIAKGCGSLSASGRCAAR